MRQAKLVVMYSLEYYKFKFRKCLLVADKRLRSGLKTHKHIAPSSSSPPPLFSQILSSPRARTFYIVLYILSLPSPFCQFSPPLIFRPFSAPPLLRAAPRSPLVPLVPLVLPSPPSPIRLIRVQKKIIRVQKKFLSESCANSPSKLSPALYKPRAKASVIPLKSRKTQIFSNFLSQSLARFRKSPYFCTR